MYDGPSGKDLGGQKKEALPHPDHSFTRNDVEYEIPEDEWSTYDDIYRRWYNKYIMGTVDTDTSRKARKWDSLSDKDKYDILKSAHRYANDKMKDAYVGSNKRK